MFSVKYHFWHFSLTQQKEEVWPGGIQHMLLAESSHICIQNFSSVATRVLLVKHHFFFLSCHYSNHFPDFYPIFKLGQNQSTCQVSEKSTHKFGHNDVTNTQRDRQTD